MKLRPKKPNVNTVSVTDTWKQGVAVDDKNSVKHCLFCLGLNFQNRAQTFSSISFEDYFIQKSCQAADSVSVTRWVMYICAMVQSWFVYPNYLEDGTNPSIQRDWKSPWRDGLDDHRPYTMYLGSKSFTQMKTCFPATGPALRIYIYMYIYIYMQYIHMYVYTAYVRMYVHIYIYIMYVHNGVILFN